MSNNLKLIFSTFFLCFLLNQNVVAQVGIGTTNPDASSILDVSSSNLGVLFPRVALTSSTDNTTISSPANGLLIYNTSTVADVTPGFYFWNVSGWTKVATGGSSGGTGWELTGNNLSSGTGNEFIGTTSWNSLQFRINNTAAGSLHPNGGITFGLGAQANNSYAVAIGLNANSSASVSSVALGHNATASSYKSVAIGSDAIASSGNNAIALGVNTTASNQNTTAIGSGATASGLNSTALGTGANASGQNAVAIGDGSVAGDPNTIILGNTIADTNFSGTKIGLGTSNPTVRLDITGSVKIVDGTQGAGKVLVSDANGKASWGDAGNDMVYGDIYKSSSAGDQVLNRFTPITFGTTGVAEGVTVNNDNFQIITAGVYRITYSLSLHSNNNGAGDVEFNLAINSRFNRVPGGETFIRLQNGEEGTITTNRMVHLSAGDLVYIYPRNSNNSVYVLENGAAFNIELLKAD